MHGIGKLDGSKAGERDTNGTEDALLTFVDENNDAKRQAEEDNNKDVTSHLKPDLEETINEIPSKGNEGKQNWSSSYVLDKQNEDQGYPSTQYAEDYNQLLNQYNEIEKQRQKIMQQLEYFNYWNSQESGPSQHWQYPVTTDHNPYYNHCMVAPCYLGGTCTSATSGIAYNAQSTFTEDSNVTKAALAAAEKAISSLKIENPEKQEEGCEGPSVAATAGETDLNAVFNAWYAAGFYTGKYVAEHSIKKKH